MRRLPLIYRPWFEPCWHLMMVLLFAAFATACGTKPTKIDVPLTVEVEVPELVALDPKLTADCMNEPARNQQLGEATRLANVRNEYLAECTARMRRIGELQPKVEHK